MPEKQILIIHPRDQSTSFLDRIKNQMVISFPQDVHHFNIYPNEQSHLNCIKRISNHPESGIIIFLGHGRSDRLFGSKGKFYDSLEFIDNEAIQEHPDKYYFNESFITKANIDVFKGKKVFCLACNSNEDIANYALDIGVQSFLGFGAIPTSNAEFENSGHLSISTLAYRMKSELNYIIKKCLIIAISENSTFQELLNYIQFVSSQRLSNILVNEKKLKERFILADYLYYLKKEVTIFGNSKAKMLV